MKSYLIFIWLMVFLYSLDVFSLDCNSCKNADYPYIGCCITPTGHERCTRCINDPLNQNDDFRPFKKCNLNTSLIDYDENGFPFANGIEWSDPNLPSDEKTIISLDDSRSDVLNSLLNWILVCLPSRQINNFDCDDCRLKVKWARDAQEMVGYPNALAITFQPIAGIPSEQKCEADCDNSYIAFNAINSFMGCDPALGQIPDDKKPCFFYTNKNTANKSTMQWYHFKSIILHEMGHWLGLGDIKGSTCYPPGSSQTTTIMNFELFPMQERDIINSDADKCAFMLLYCCDLDGIEEEKNENDLSTFPNPFSDKIRVAFSEGNQSETSLIIYDLQGNKLLNITLPLNTKYYDIDMSSFSKGIYLMRLIQGKDVRIEKLVKY